MTDETLPEGQERRQGERRYDPMGDAAAEKALRFLLETAGAAGKAKADMVYMEHWVKIVLSRLKQNSLAKSDSASETEARAHPDYAAACEAQRDAIERYETLYWKRITAQATIEAWRTRAANDRDAGRMR